MVAGYKTRQASSQPNRSESSNFERTKGIKTKWTNAPILQCLTYVVCNFLHTRFDIRLCAFGMHIHEFTHEFTTFQNVQYSWNTSRQTNVHYFIIIIFNRVSCMATINFRSVSFAPKVLWELHRNEIWSWVEYWLHRCMHSKYTKYFAYQPS